MKQRDEMNCQSAPAQPQISPSPHTKPPHPFRASPWYDPSVEHRLCQCPNCRSPKGARSWRQPFKTVLVVLGGVLLPLVSVVVNHWLRVVDLDLQGNAAVLLAVAATMANLALSPCRRDPDTGEVSHRPPSSTGLRVALLAGALLGCVTWGYLALLFLPLAPLSIIAVIWLGLGLCGLCPFGALAISIIQAVRGVRAVRRRLGRAVTWGVTLASLLVPPAALGGVGLHHHFQRLQVDQQLIKIMDLRPYSYQRMAAVTGLEGKEQHLVRAYMATQDRGRHRLLAEVFLRLTDRRINAEVTRQVKDRGNTVINPWWFLQGTGQVWLLDFWRNF